ncbi:MAG: beta-hydroxyacyl-ACP dehydratase, partial [bacterium]|nr:beta-hydroxyacyl-ACP dehydratase [bacterium]
MKFILIDRIVELVPGERITAVKALSRAEEYLADHFPRFPVMPGVLMVEAMIQGASWLIRATEDFAHSMLQLAEAKNVTYKSFVSPGQVFEL